MDDQNTFQNKKTPLYIIVVILAATSLCYRLIGNYHFQQTALLFVGLPTLITLLVVRFTNTPKTLYGIVFKVITLFLLMSGILLGEGILCIIMAAPIFYGVAALIVFIIERSRKQDKLNGLALIPVLLICAQLTDYTKPQETQSILVSQSFAQKIDFNQLNKTPDFMENLPTFFKMGFPKPIAIKGSGFAVGDERVITFESNTKGVGHLRLKIVERTPEKITFKAIEDDSHISHWMTWKEIEISIKQQNNGTYELNWEVDYTCDLKPSWYFEPIEKYAVEQSSHFLIENYFNH